MFPSVFAHLVAAPAITALVGAPPNARIYGHGEAPQNAVAPYIVWLVADNGPEASLDSVPTMDRVVFQVDVYHATGGGVQTLAKAVRDALEPYCAMTGLVADERGAVEPRHFRVALQFDYWLSR